MMENYHDSICLDLEKALADETVVPIDLPFLFLKAITRDFSDDQRIGSGGFGSVYKVRTYMCALHLSYQLGAASD